MTNGPSSEFYQNIQISRQERVRAFLGDEVTAAEMEQAASIARDFSDTDTLMASTAVLIPVAAHQEAARILPAMSQYARQDTREPFTIFMLLNSPEDEAESPAVSESVRQVDIARRLYPELDIRQSITSYPDPIIGKIRRDLWNAVTLLAEHEQIFTRDSTDSVGINHDVIGISHDIDSVYISPRYIDRVQRFYWLRQLGYEVLEQPEALMAPRGTAVRHAYPANYPHIGRAIAWTDMTFAQMRRAFHYEEGTTVPLSWYAYSCGFDPTARTYETANVKMGKRARVIPGTLMETSPRRYIDRLQQHGLREIWQDGTFGADDACRTRLPAQDITKERLEDIILEDLEDTLWSRWYFPVTFDACDAAMENIGKDRPEMIAAVDASVERSVRRQHHKIDRMLRSVIRSDILADMVSSAHPAASIVEGFKKSSVLALDNASMLPPEEPTEAAELNFAFSPAAK